MATMTSKEALGVLHQVYRTYVDLLIQSAEPFSASDPLRQQAIQAFFRLTDDIHGPREEGESLVLCDSCHLRRAWHDIGYRDYCDACRPQETAISVAQPCSAAPDISYASEEGK